MMPPLPPVPIGYNIPEPHVHSGLVIRLVFCRPICRQPQLGEILIVLAVSCKRHHFTDLPAFSSIYLLSGLLLCYSLPCRGRGIIVLFGADPSLSCHAFPALWAATYFFADINATLNTHQWNVSLQWVAVNLDSCLPMVQEAAQVQLHHVCCGKLLVDAAAFDSSTILYAPLYQCSYKEPQCNFFLFFKSYF